MPCRFTRCATGQGKEIPARKRARWGIAGCPAAHPRKIQACFGGGPDRHRKERAPHCGVALVVFVGEHQGVRWAIGREPVPDFGRERNRIEYQSSSPCARYLDRMAAQFHLVSRRKDRPAQHSGQDRIHRQRYGRGGVRCRVRTHADADRSFRSARTLW